MPEKLSRVLFAAMGLAIAGASLDPELVPGSLDKALHFSAYSLWALCAVQAAPSKRVRRALLGGILAFGGLVEVIQPAFGRSGSLVDALANGAGTFLGAATGAWLRYRRFTPRESLLLGAVVTVFLGAVAYEAGPRVTHRLGNWDCDHAFVVGDEVGGGRPWRGELLCARLMAGPEGLSASGSETPVCGQPPPAEARAVLELGSLSSRGSPFVDAPLRDASTRAFCEASRRSDVQVLEAWFRADDLEQPGPARIVTFSASPYARNLTLAQWGSTLDFRVRSWTGGDNGRRYSIQTPKGTVTGEVQHAVAVVREDLATLAIPGGPRIGPRRIGGDTFTVMARAGLLLGGAGVSVTLLASLGLALLRR